MAPQKSRVPIPKGSANPDQSGSLPIKGTVRQGISTGSQGRPQLKKNVFTRPSNRSRRSGSDPDRSHSPPLTFGPDQNLSDEDRQLRRCTQHRGPSSQKTPDIYGKTRASIVYKSTFIVVKKSTIYVANKSRRHIFSDPCHEIFPQLQEITEI